MAILVDSRRLTGANLLSDGPGAIMDLSFRDDEDPEAFVAAWRRQLTEMLDHLGWHDAALHARQVGPGQWSLAFDAPIDALYAATEINEWAFSAVDSGQTLAASEDQVRHLNELIEEERNPALIALSEEAARRGVTLLWDDEFVSLGMGASCEIHPATELPAPDEVDWGRYRDLPSALVTGTNGKTTVARYLASILQAAGKVAGLSSTDWIRIGDELVEEGDYSGPGGARTVLRHPRTEAAVLETARGGLQRRGLGVARADTAVITNIAADHLGDFGVPDVHALLDIKWVVTRAMDAESLLVLNADDPLLVARAQRPPCPLAWFSLNPDDGTVHAHTERHGLAARLHDDQLELFRDGAWRRLMAAREVALTMEGLARHNLANALAAALAACGMGIGPGGIARGLASTAVEDNPGRCSMFRLRGAKVLVDFAHNPHGLEALFELARTLPARRRLLMIGQAGDRRDADIRALAEEAWALGLDHVVVKEMGKYRRGRAPREVPGILTDAFREAGAEDAQVTYRETEPEGLEFALEWLEPGDLAILLVHEEIEAVIGRLREVAD